MTAVNLGQAAAVQQPGAGQSDYIAEPPWLNGEVQEAPPASPRPEEFGFYVNKEEKAAAEGRLVEVVEKVTRQEEAKARAEEAKLERAKLATGVTLPPLADPSAITLQVARATDTATVKLEYLMDPFLPGRCVVCFAGRGGTAKSSFLASVAAYASPYAGSLWVSVEELPDWIRVRHIKAGGQDGTLAVVAAVATKKDAQGRVTGSSFNIYEHLEPAILKAETGFRSEGRPPLRLVVLDTAVGLTNWAKGESPNDDSAVKRLLAYLQSLAEKHDLTIAFIQHANKQRKPDHFADTVAGSSAWTNSPRLSFVHARDRREEHAYVVRVAKSNLTQAFGMAYRTEPIHTLYERPEGADSVLCRVLPSPVVWGEEESMTLYDEATRRPDADHDDGGGGDHRPNLVSRVVRALVELASESEEPVTREMVEGKFGRAIARREWTKVDEQLAIGHLVFKITVEAGPKNKVLYRRQT